MNNFYNDESLDRVATKVQQRLNAAWEGLAKRNDVQLLDTTQFLSRENRKEEAQLIKEERNIKQEDSNVEEVKVSNKCQSGVLQKITKSCSNAFNETIILQMISIIQRRQLCII